MKKFETKNRLIPLGRVSRETRAINGRVAEMSNPILSYNPS
jgi:hypothetical protein